MFLVQKRIQNPHASIPLYLPILVQNNTASDELKRNVRINAARDLRWVRSQEKNDRKAVMVGGGASISDFVENIRVKQKRGGVVFAMNAASQWLNWRGIVPDYQVIIDAKPETATLVDPHAKAHLFGSQVNPATMEAVENPIVWHCGFDGVEELFPPEKVKRGGYALFGGGIGVGTYAMTLAYGLGHRDFHVFGYDSCNKDGRTHAYAQPMNASIPTIEVEWGGRVYTSSVGMRGHAAAFQRVARQLKERGCTIEMYGDGLCQAMYRTKPGEMTERDKYRLMWANDDYRIISPGEQCVDQFIRLTEPDLVIDFGCGTGRASIALAKAGYSPFLLDFADNCRDPEAMQFPFIDCDLTKSCYLRAPYGYCTDVMEHIPTDDVPTVIANIMASAAQVFFKIATTADSFGDSIGVALHNTVRPAKWWSEMFTGLGFTITWQEQSHRDCRFFVTR